MKGIGFVLLCITCGFVIVKYDMLSWWSLGLGAAVALAFFAFLSAFKTEPPAPPPTHNPWEDRFHELETHTALTVEGLNREIQKLQQKLIRSDERCLSYQNLVDVHQGEIDRLKGENRQLGEGLIQKERKINEMKLAHLQPDLFEADKRNIEMAYRELKKELEEKTRLLDQSQSHLTKVEQELLTLQKPKNQHENLSEKTLSEQLRQSQEEKKALEAELISLQQLVAELALPEEEPF